MVWVSFVAPTLWPVMWCVTVSNEWASVCLHTLSATRENAMRGNEVCCWGLRGEDIGRRVRMVNVKREKGAYNWPEKGNGKFNRIWKRKKMVKKTGFWPCYLILLAFEESVKASLIWLNTTKIFFGCCFCFWNCVVFVRLSLGPSTSTTTSWSVNALLLSPLRTWLGIWLLPFKSYLISDIFRNTGNLIDKKMKTSTKYTKSTGCNLVKYEWLYFRFFKSAFLTREPNRNYIVQMKI